MNIKSIAKYIKPFAFAGVLVFSVGCTEDAKEEAQPVTNNSKENIRTLFHEKFDGPNEELEQIWNELNDDDSLDKEKLDKYSKKLDAYYEDNVFPLYHDGMDEQAVRYVALEHLRSSHANGYELHIKDINLKESEKTKNSFNYSIEIEKLKDGSVRKTIKLRGLINTNEEQRITRIRYHNQEELFNALKN